jgi:hypothetical protein
VLARVFGMAIMLFLQCHASLYENLYFSPIWQSNYQYTDLVGLIATVISHARRPRGLPGASEGMTDHLEHQG